MNNQELLQKMKEDMVKNIVDLEGNFKEWTTELSPQDMHYLFLNNLKGKNF